MTSIIIVLLILSIDSYSLIYLYDILIPIFVVQLVYFTIKAILENKRHGLSKGFGKFFVLVRLLVFYLFLSLFLNGSSITSTTSWYISLFVPYREKDISELLLEDSNESTGITLNEFFIILKRKFNRS